MKTVFSILVLLALVLVAGCGREPYVNKCTACLDKGLARCVHCDEKGFDNCRCGGGTHARAAEPDLDGVAFTHAFAEPPKVGDIVLKLSTDDPRKSSLKAFAAYDMPSMRGAHATKVQFRLNKKGDFVIPIHFAMPGDWEIVVTFEDASGKLIARKTINLEI